MMILDITPDVLKQTAGTACEMKTETLETGAHAGWEETRIIDNSNENAEIGVGRQASNTRHTVRFFKGKGGFCAVIENDHLVYIGLPGSQIKLADTEVELPGPPIVGKSAHLISKTQDAPKQTVCTQAMILGAGLATRFEPVSGDTTGFPKPGVPLAGADTVISSIARLLKKHGMTTIYVNTFYKPEALKAPLDEIDGITVHYIDETAPSGTAGGLLKALQKNQVDTTQPMLVIQGDAITDADLSFLLSAHDEHQAIVTIGGQIVPDEDVQKFGMIVTDTSGADGQSGNIQRFQEKPTLEEAGDCRFGNTGFYVLSPESYALFQAVGIPLLETGQLFDYAQHFFPAVLEHVSASGSSQPFWAQTMGGYWSDIGNPVQYAQAVRDVYSGSVAIDLPENQQDYYRDGVILWPGVAELLDSNNITLQGNVIVALKP